MSYQFNHNNENKNYKDKESKQIFPITKITARHRPLPQNNPDVIRIRFLEKPWRYYLGISQNWQTFMMTVVLSAALIFIPYHLVYYISYSRSKAEILSKQDPSFTSDGMRNYIKSFNQRKQEGLVESMQEVIDHKAVKETYQSAYLKEEKSRNDEQ